MSFAQKVERLKEITWQESGLATAIAFATAVATPLWNVVGYFWPEQLKRVKQMLPHIDWYWGPLILLAWLAWCFWKKIVAYETPVVALEFSEYQGDWYLRVTNKSKRDVRCTINFEEIEDASSGTPVVPVSYGLDWNEGKARTNDMGIKGEGSVKVLFARLIDKEARLFGTDTSCEAFPIKLKEGKYLITLRVHAGVANLPNKIRLLNDGRKISIA